MNMITILELLAGLQEEFKARWFRFTMPELYERDKNLVIRQGKAINSNLVDMDQKVADKAA
jgi:hypothetical protein